MKSTQYSIVADPRYGYLRVDPVPSEAEVQRFYKEEFYSNWRHFNDSSLEVQRREKAFFDSRWEAICYRIQQFFGRIAGLSAFDIGCGYGQALLYLREKGMLVSGLEPTAEGCEYCRCSNLAVHQAGIEDYACVGAARFNVVTLINVLEHLRQPAETLSSIRQSLLEPGGLLVIDVPNDFNDFQVAADAEYDLGQWWVCPPNHINYFSCDSLCRLVEETGYRVVAKEASFPLELFLLMGDVFVGDGELGKICHEKRVAFEQVMRKHDKGDTLRRLYEKLAELSLGRQLVLYATPARA